MLRFAGIFLTVLFVLFGIEMLNPVQKAVVQPFTFFLAEVSSAIIAPFDDTAISFGKIIQNKVNGFAVSIESGCNGVEAIIMLAAAVIAFPATVKQKVAAIILGSLAIQVLNIARIVSLYYLGQWSFAAFEWAHLYIWPVLIMVDVLIVFLVWLNYLNRQSPQTNEAAA